MVAAALGGFASIIAAYSAHQDSAKLALLAEESKIESRATRLVTEGAWSVGFLVLKNGH